MSEKHILFESSNYNIKTGCTIKLSFLLNIYIYINYIDQYHKHPQIK